MLCCLMLLESDRDKTAFAQTYAAYSSMLLRVARGVLGADSTRAEDAVHNAFISVANNFEKFSQISCQERAPYLVTIVKNACRDILRKDKKYAPWEMDSDADRGDTPQLDGLDEAYRRAVALIYALPDRYRTILELRLILGLRNQEAAQRLGISEDTAAQRYARGRKMVAEQLTKEGLRLD